MRTLKWMLGMTAGLSFWLLGLAVWAIGWLLILAPWSLYIEVHNKNSSLRGTPRMGCKTCERYKAVTIGFRKAGYACLVWPFRSRSKSKV